ncbi:MAG: nucleotidyltransferase domain-containing protein [Candidatus Bathyarchaeia archaeon]
MRSVKHVKEPEFRYFRMKADERMRLLDRLRKSLKEIDSIVFAYVHGGFIELDSFRDLDVAVWVKDPQNAFQYAVDLSAKIGIRIGVPTDIHVLNKAPLPFRYHVFVRGKLLLSKDEDSRLKALDTTSREYFDLKGLRAINGSFESEKHA